MFRQFTATVRAKDKNRGHVHSDMRIKKISKRCTANLQEHARPTGGDKQLSWWLHAKWGMKYLCWLQIAYKSTQTWERSRSKLYITSQNNTENVNMRKLPHCRVFRTTNKKNSYERNKALAKPQYIQGGHFMIKTVDVFTQVYVKNNQGNTAAVD